MKRNIIVVFIFLICLNSAYTQGVKNIVDNEVNPGEVLVEFDNRSTSVKGSHYLIEEWKKGDINLKTGSEIKSQWIRYDLKSDMLEIKLNDEVKVVPLGKLENFHLIDIETGQFYSNCDRYSFQDGTALSGICQVLDTGRYGAIIKYDYSIKKADYVPALDMGSREDEIIINKFTFLTRNKNIYKLPKRRKDFYDFFINPTTDIKSFMKKNGLNHKKQDDLVRILSYLKKNSVD